MAHFFVSFAFLFSPPSSIEKLYAFAVNAGSPVVIFCLIHLLLIDFLYFPLVSSLPNS